MFSQGTAVCPTCSRVNHHSLGEFNAAVGQMSYSCFHCATPFKTAVFDASSGIPPDFLLDFSAIANDIRSREMIEFAEAEVIVPSRIEIVERRRDDAMFQLPSEGGAEPKQFELHNKEKTLLAGGGGEDQRIIEEVYCETCEDQRPCRVHAQQTRGADEGQTIFYECTICKAKWQSFS